MCGNQRIAKGRDTGRSVSATPSLPIVIDRDS